MEEKSILEDDKFGEMAELIKSDNLDGAGELFSKHFSRTSSIYGKFDNLAKELGFEKQEGVSTVDHYTSHVQSLNQTLKEKEAAIAEATSKLDSFSDQTKQWDATKSELEQQSQQAIEQHQSTINSIADAFLLKSIENSNIAEEYKGDEFLIKAIVQGLKSEYDFKFEGTELIPTTKEGERVIKDGKVLTLEDLKAPILKRYEATNKPKLPNLDTEGGNKEGGSLHYKAIAAGHKSGSREYFAFIRNNQ